MVKIRDHAYLKEALLADDLIMLNSTVVQAQTCACGTILTTNTTPYKYLPTKPLKGSEV